MHEPTPAPLGGEARHGPYRDPKRAAWLWALAVPALAGAGPLLWTVWPSDWALWVPVAFVYLAAPLIDTLLGADKSNPPESAISGLQSDPYYARITQALVPLLWVAWGAAAWFSVWADIGVTGLAGLILSTGVVGGFCINLGHELGHQGGLRERLLSQAVLVITGYGHFTLEHNRGHHRDVATPADSASARMGESVWRFAAREMPGAVRRAWALEAARLAQEGRGVVSPHNTLLRSWAVTAMIWAGLAAWLGVAVFAFLLPAALWANFQLTSANYVEHYGLLRRVGPDARLEPCGPQHSWNSNHLFSNWASFHLQRHADHHAHPRRRYQALRHFDQSPQLPSGYFAMFILAYLPWLWSRVMDPLLVRQVQGDPSRVNFDPSRRQALIERWFAGPGRTGPLAS